MSAQETKLHEGQIITLYSAIGGAEQVEILGVSTVVRWRYLSYPSLVFESLYSVLIDGTNPDLLNAGNQIEL